MTKTICVENHAECQIGRFARTGRSAFTLIELLVVIAIIGLLAGLVVGLSNHAAASSRYSRIRAELKQLETAIEAYKSKIGQYPPDNIVSRPPWTPSIVVNPVLNPLFYELSGTIVENDRFRIPNENVGIASATIQQFFNVEGFANASPNPKNVKGFIKDLKSTQVGKISPTDDVKVLVVPVPWPLNNPNFQSPINSTDPSVKQVNPWRYNVSNPTNNPGGFDLWAEFVDGKKVKIICNWSKDILDKP